VMVRIGLPRVCGAVLVAVASGLFFGFGAEIDMCGRECEGGS